MLSEYTAVIQAGGKGTRLRELTGDKIPKPLLSLNGKTMIEWQLACIRRYGIRDVVLIIGHLGDKVKAYFGDGAAFDMHIRYIEEEEPLGSAGALYCLKDSLPGSNFLLIFGDVMFDIDVERMVRFHEKHQALATLLVHPNAHPFDSDLVVLDEEERVTGFDSKTNVRKYWYDNCVNAGIFVLSKQLLDQITALKKYDLEHDLLFPAIGTGRVYGYRSTEYVKDAGTVKRFHDVCEEQKQGLWQARNLGNRQKCIFLDRDGTLNRYKGLIDTDSLLELEEGAAEAVREINRSGYLAIVVTNQPVVARGMCSLEDVRNIHRKMSVLLGEQGAYLDDIIFCPHHPDKGYPEENPLYKIPCNCRKPATGMLEEMAERHHIDLARSWMIGDSTADIQTGKNAGVKTMLVRTGQAGKDGKYDAEPDLEASDLAEAVKKILALES